MIEDVAPALREAASVINKATRAPHSVALDLGHIADKCDLLQSLRVRQRVLEMAMEEGVEDWELRDIGDWVRRRSNEWRWQS